MAHYASRQQNFIDFLAEYGRDAINRAAEEVIKKETEDFRRRIAKKVYKDIDNMVMHYMERLSPHKLTTQLYIGFTEKKV